MENLKRILVVEDEEALSKALKLKLVSSGFEVIIASDGDEALNYISFNHFDLILLDIIMPKKNGFEVLESMRHLNMNLPIIVLSNLSQDEDIKKTKELGASEFIIKSNTSLTQIVNLIKQKYAN